MYLLIKLYIVRSGSTLTDIWHYIWVKSHASDNTSARTHLFSNRVKQRQVRAGKKQQQHAQLLRASALPCARAWWRSTCLKPGLLTLWGWRPRLTPYRPSYDWSFFSPLWWVPLPFQSGSGGTLEGEEEKEGRKKETIDDLTVSMLLHIWFHIL